MERKIGARFIVGAGDKPIRNGILTFSEDGVLTGVQADVSAAEMGEVEYFDGIVSPGFVNSHCHLELSYMKGVIPSGTGLPGFIRRIMETKFTFAEDVQRRAIAEADAYLWKSGVQAVGDISNTTVSFDVKAASSVKYVTFIEIFNVLMGLPAQTVIDNGLAVYDEALRRRLEAYLTLHAVYSVSKELFRDFSKAPHTECLSVHYKESADDDLLFDGRGEFYRLFTEKGLDLDFLDEVGSTSRILKNIPADRRLLLVHNSHINQADIDSLTSCYKNISFALCPRSNVYIEGGLPSVSLLMRNGLNLTVGTDSLSSNTSLSMIEELKTFVFLSGVDEVEVLRWATVNGARAFGLGDIGAFGVGMCPGVVLVDGVTDDMRFTKDTNSRRIL